MPNKHIKRDNSQKSELIHDLHKHCINIDSREIFLQNSSDDQEEAGIDFKMSSMLIKNLNLLSSFSDEPILIHSFNRGGECDHGFAVYDSIKNCSCVTTMLIHTMAASMGSIILQAADYRVMMPHSTFMIHYGSAHVEDTTTSVITYARELQKLQQQLLDIYVERIASAPKWENATPSQIKSFLIRKMEQKQEWYLTAREAVDYGFADAVLGDPEYNTVEMLRL